MMNRRDFSMAALAALFAGAASAVPLPQGGGGRGGRGGGRGGMGGGRGGMGGGRGMSGRFVPSMSPGAINNAILTGKLQATDPKEKQILDVIQELLTQPRSLSVPQGDGRFLRLITQFSGAKNVVEIGTYHGMSALWFAMALQQTGGKLTTHDIDADVIKIAQENFKKAGVEKTVTVVQGDAHDKVKTLEGPIDILFQDADKEGYLDYLDKLLPKVRPGGLIISHNINPQQADADYIKRITTDPQLETILVTLADSGISMSLKKA